MKMKRSEVQKNLIDLKLVWVVKSFGDAATSLSSTGDTRKKTTFSSTGDTRQNDALFYGSWSRCDDWFEIWNIRFALGETRGLFSICYKIWSSALQVDLATFYS